MFEYRKLLGPEPVDSVVLCLKRGRRQGTPRGIHVGRGRVTTTTLRFPVVCLWDLTARELDYNDPNYQVIVAVRAIKPY